MVYLNKNQVIRQSLYFSKRQVTGRNKKFFSNIMPQDRNILLVTHNGRMICFLEDIITKKMSEYRTRMKVDEIRFKNGAVLLLEINKTQKKLSLIFEGIVNKPYIY